MKVQQRVNLVVRGRVQGVGFRYFVWRRASALGLDGEVRNLPGGEVAVLAWGESGKLEELIESVRRGPPSARILEVEVRYDSGPAPAPGFHVTE